MQFINSLTNALETHGQRGDLRLRHTRITAGEIFGDLCDFVNDALAEALGWNAGVTALAVVTAILIVTRAFEDTQE